MKKTILYAYALILLLALAAASPSSAAKKAPQFPLTAECFSGLKDRGFACEYDGMPLDGLEVLRVNVFRPDSIGSVGFSLYFYREKSEVSIRLWNLREIREKDAALETVCAINNAYRFYHFYWEEDGMISAKCDVPVRAGSAAEVCAELLSRGIDILEKTDRLTAGF